MALKLVSSCGLNGTGLPLLLSLYTDVKAPAPQEKAEKENQPFRQEHAWIDSKKRCMNPSKVFANQMGQVPKSCINAIAASGFDFDPGTKKTASISHGAHPGLRYTVNIV